MSNSTDIVILSDAGKQIGLGHFSRMSNICENLIKRGYSARLYLNCEDDIKDIVSREYVVFCNWLESYKKCKYINSSTVVIVDSYQVSLSFLKLLKKQCKELIVIDDNIRLKYEDMVIVNLNYFGEYLEYPQNKNNVYFVGKDCLSLRDAFKPPKKKRIKRNVNNIMISMGGTDVLGLTPIIIETVHRIKSNIKLDVIVTNAFSNLDEIKGLLTSKDELHIDATAEIMAKLMNKVDFSISSAGGTVNELIKMKCPAMITIVADNQMLNYKHLTNNDMVKGFDVNNLDSSIEKMLLYETRMKLYNKIRNVESNGSIIDKIAHFLET